MEGPDLDKPLTCRYASFRYFEKGEHHVARFCTENVLLLVFGGVLRFSENGIQCEVRQGEYYIQKKDQWQAGEIASDSPEYLYVHFDGEWSDDANVIPRQGNFDIKSMLRLMSAIDDVSHRGGTLAERQYLLLEILLKLKSSRQMDERARALSKYVENNIARMLTLSDICSEFHYSKNYIIQLFKREFGLSPMQYINDMRIKRAMYLIETTSRPLKDIMEECGFSDYPYFYKRFVQKTGLPPMSWRRMMQQKPCGV